MTDDLFVPLTPANPAAPKPKCRRHVWIREQQSTLVYCGVCEKVRDDVLSRRGRNAKKRGISDEVAVAKILGARHVGPLKLPWDVEIEGYLRAQAKKWDRWPSMNEIAAFIAAIPAGPHMRAATLADTPGSGGRTARYIVIPLAEFARWHGAAQGDEA